MIPLVHIIRIGGFLSFLATGALLIIGVLVLLHALVTRRFQRAGRVATGMVALLLLYGAALVATSLTSRERVLARGAEKYFCDLDCDLSVSVASVRSARTLGAPDHPVSSSGEFLIVALRGRSIAARVEMFIASPRVEVVAADGRRFRISRAGQEALARIEGKGPPLDQRLSPGETFVTDLVFDLPEDVREPRLALIAGDPIGRFVMGDENAFLHRQVLLQL